MGVLGVVEDEVLDTEFLGKHACIQGGAVVFLVGVENEAVLVEAEGFAHQPVTSAGVWFTLNAVGLVAQADESLTIRQLRTETVLLEVGRADIKECHLHIIDVHFFAVEYLTQEDGLPERIKDFGRNHEVSHRLEGMAHFIVAIDGENALVLALEDHGRNLADHPDGTHDVVGVAMGDKHVIDVLEGDVGCNELAQDTIAAPAVNEHPPFGSMQVETGVETVDAHGIARSEHGDV